MTTPREQAESLARDLDIDNRDGAVDEMERIFEATAAEHAAQLAEARAEGMKAAAAIANTMAAEVDDYRAHVAWHIRDRITAAIPVPK